MIATRRHRSPARFRTLPGLAIAAACACTAIAAQEPSEILEQIRSATLDPERAVDLRSVEIDMGLGSLLVEQGWLVPARPIAGHTAEMAFVGHARFRLRPPDPIETAQLELFTGERSLDVEVQKALLVSGDAAVSEALLQRPSTTTIDESSLQTATELFAAWVGGAERRGIGADAAVFRTTLGDPTHRRYFTAVLESEKLGRFYYLLDPDELEQITLGQFVPLELDDRDRYRTERAIRRAKRSGRAIQARLEDLGDWDTWVQTQAFDEDGREQPGGAVFEPTSYQIDVTISPKDERIEAIARIDVVAQRGGARTVDLTLFEDLRPSAVSDGEGNALPWFRSGSDLHVLLPAPLATDETARIEVTYAGVLLEELESGIFSSRDTYTWYPHVGTFDRATYDVTLRRPRRLGLLASGRQVETRDEAGQTIERRVLDVPSRAFGFEVGAFDIVHETVGHVELTVGFSKSTLAKDSGAREDVLDTLRKGLAFYEETFGPYPFDHLTVATIPRGFSQGFLSFLTLSHHLLATYRGWYFTPFGTEDPQQWRRRQRMETVAHELAHQWWGNKVGWYNYRDQWLSEALADYSAVVYTASQADSRPLYLLEHAADWKNQLQDTTRDGRTIESLGPVVLGQRLGSSVSTQAYSAIVYSKGSVVFSMLASILQQEQMNQMLGELATRVGNRAIDTPTFIRSLERMSGFDLTTFASQFIYGTGIPEVYYTYRFAEAGDKWRVEGEARMVAPADYRYTLLREDGWDVVRERVETVDVSDWALLVPFQILLAGAEERSTGTRSVARGLGGKLIIRGASTPFSFDLEQRPQQFWLDQRGQVLASFFCENHEPKRMLLYQAMELEGNEAAALFEQALRTPLLSEEKRESTEMSDKALARQERLLDARIQLHLARLQLDGRQTAAARESLKAAERLIPSLDARYQSATRSFLAARIALQEGDYETAFRESRSLRLSFPHQDDNSLVQDLRRGRWRDGRTGDGEDYAVLAVAAYETGHLPVARRAMEEAEERGADMKPLRELLGAS